MTLKQKILKLTYPLLILGQRLSGQRKVISNELNKTPNLPIYNLNVLLSDGQTLPLHQLKGKKMLIVNTASDCGYTPQYAELQKLYEQKKDDLEIIAVPSNDFKEQEKRSDAEITQFCSINYGVRFPLAKKAVVKKETAQSPLFRWLSSRDENGWLNKAPSWNFSKYLINEQGVLTHYFDPAVSPMGEEMLNAINK